MSTIKELWVLQQHYNELSEINKNIKDPSTLVKIKTLGTLLKDAETRLKDLQDRINTREKTLMKNSMLLRDLEYQLEEIEKNLYHENITDVKQLTILDREREVIKNNIEDLETDLLDNMELIEELKKEFSYLTENFNKNRKEYTRLVKEHRTYMKQCKDSANVKQEEIKKIISTIDLVLLKRFDNLIESKKIAVVEVVDNRCGGCNMVLPSIIIDKLNEDNEIVLCENCHRILYLP